MTETNSKAYWCNQDISLINHSYYFDYAHMDEIFSIKANLNYYMQLSKTELIDAIPHLSILLATVREHLLNKDGFYILKGFPIIQLNITEIKTIYQILGKMLGNVLPQNKGLERVVDVRMDEKNLTNGRGYLSNVELDFHTDPCDIVGLLCIEQAENGGLSKIISSRMIYDIISHTNPELAEVGFTSFVIKDVENKLSSTNNINHSFPVYNLENGKLFSRVAPGYTKILLLEKELNPLQKKQLQLLELIQSIANDPNHFLGMQLFPGDIQFLNNNLIYHARTAFEDSDIHRRHMVRLWIDVPEFNSYPNLFAI